MTIPSTDEHPIVRRRRRWDVVLAAGALMALAGLAAYSIHQACFNASPALAIPYEGSARAGFCDAATGVGMWQALLVAFGGIAGAATQLVPLPRSNRWHATTAVGALLLVLMLVVSSLDPGSSGL
jgi:hypothetical protein